MKYVAMTNRGAQLALGSKEDCEKVAGKVNSEGGEIFAWVIEAPAGAVEEDMPGLGFIYG